MKLNITYDQNDNRIIGCELPLIGYFLIRQEGGRPVLSLEEPWYGRSRYLFRGAGIIGAILIIMDLFTLMVGVGGMGLLLLIINVFSELIDITKRQKHQVLRVSGEQIST